MHSENQNPRKMYLCVVTYESAHLRNCPGKSQKIDFSPENLMELWPFWYHSYGFSKLYKFIYVDLFTGVENHLIPGIQPISR